jgi:thiol-disulfide isomerase/thioredoxin
VEILRHAVAAPYHCKMGFSGIVFLLLPALLAGCVQKKEFQVVVMTGDSAYDTLYIHELITNRELARVPLADGGKMYPFPIAEATLAELRLNGSDNSYLTIVSPGAKKTLWIVGDQAQTRNAIADSLANYLWKSTNQMFAVHGNVIFGRDNPDGVKELFDSLIQVRTEQIQQHEHKLTSDELGILHYQNKARAYSFMMFYGRIIKRYDATNDFFNFIGNIDQEAGYAKTLPDNLLYKYEILFLRQQDSIPGVVSFLEFIEQQTKARDLQDYLKAIYLREVIESPSYWRNHHHLFTTTTMNAALAREQSNRYAYLVEGASRSFNFSQAGMMGFDFTATTVEGAKLKLSDLKGKIVVIDAWATWCGPCLQHRPQMLEIARKFKDNPKVAVLMISVDSSMDRWKNVVQKTNPENYGVELIVPDGMDAEFGERYLIKSIPKYMLIGKDGIILDSTLPEPSARMEEIIWRAVEGI